MILADAMMSPQSPTGLFAMSVVEADESARIPRSMTQWHVEVLTLWADFCRPWRLNGTHRVSPLHRPISMGSVPDSNPENTGWRWISADWRQIKTVKPDVCEWVVHGDYIHCFWTPAAVCLRSNGEYGQMRSLPVAGAFLPGTNAGLLPYGCLVRVSSSRLGVGRPTCNCFDSKPKRPVTLRRTVDSLIR